MCASVALGTLPMAASCTALVVLSRPTLGPHNPLLRRSPSAVEPEGGKAGQNASNFPSRFRPTLYANESDTLAENDAMAEMNDLGDLRTEADDDLLIRYQELDDQAAIAELDSRYHRRLVAYLRKKGGLLRAWAEEIVQEAFLTFHQKRKTYPRQSSVHSLLYKILTDAARDYLKYAEADKRDHRRTVHLDWQGDHRDDFDGECRDAGCNGLEDPKTSQHALKIKLDEILGTLKPDQAEAVRLTRIEGHSIESAGALLGLKPKTVHKRAERAIDVLREQERDND